MKVNELMIGDWVRYHSKLIKVTSLYAKPTKEGDFVSNEVGWSYDASTWVDGDFIEPIPLTPEILERNGFVKDAWGEWWHRFTDGFGSDFQLSITESGFSMKDIGNAKINFVHQFQHALRLYGLNELADNLKLEQ